MSGFYLDNHVSDSQTKKQKKSKKTNQKKTKEIIKEYKLKMNSFYPGKSSPNIFVNKLEYRMKQYYNLYKSKKDIMK
jgi:hypothetical protein